MSSHPLDHLLTDLGLESLVPDAPRDQPTFSVIVRTQGRRPRSLAEAIDSVLAQTYPHFSILVMAHGDAETLEEVQGQLPQSHMATPHQVVSVSGGGRSRPLNRGLDLAQGDYVCVLDDDDLARTNWLAGFASGIKEAPGQIVRAVTESQQWTTDGGNEPLRPAGPVERPYPPSFDFLAHTSRNETPLCALALPREALDKFKLRFDDTLPVLEDWDLLMRLAMLVGVHSIADTTTLYRRLDHGNAHSAHGEAEWNEAHATVIDRLSSRPLLLPVGDARRVASGHFLPGGESRHNHELEEARGELEAVTRSPLRWAQAFGRRARRALQRRIEARRT